MVGLRFSSFGMGLVAASFAAFLARSLAAPSAWALVPAVGLASAAAAAAGLWRLPERRAMAALAGGLCGLAAVRLALLVVPGGGAGLADALLLAGLAVACAAAARAALEPWREATRGLRWGLALAGVGYFAKMVGAVDVEDAHGRDAPSHRLVERRGVHQRPPGKGAHAAPSAARPHQRFACRAGRLTPRRARGARPAAPPRGARRG